MLVAATKTPVLRNKNYVVSGAACAGGGGVPGPAPRLEVVTRVPGQRVVGEDLRNYADIRTAAECAALCHRARGCEAYEHVGAVPGDPWHSHVCRLKHAVRGLAASTSPGIVSGYAPYVCRTSVLEQREAIGQNLAAVRSADTAACVALCRAAPGCVGFSFSRGARLCFLKAEVKYVQAAAGVTAGRACYSPPSLSNSSVSAARASVAGARSPVMSAVMSRPGVDCRLLQHGNSSQGTHNSTRSRRGLNDQIRLDSPPNIDILINPDLKYKREEYEHYVMNKLKNFFKTRNSTKIYPNLFRLLWYTKTPCFDLFRMTGDHAHVLKYCQWAGEEVACEQLFEAVPTDVGICCAFNFNSSLTETTYAKLIRELKDKERRTLDAGPDTLGRGVLRGKVGFDMGLKVVLDSHSNLASPATISSDGNAFQVFICTVPCTILYCTVLFQVYIGNPGEFPFLRNRAVQADM